MVDVMSKVLIKLVILSRKSKKNEALRKLQETATKCRNCGGLYPHTNHCPAKGKQCKKCGKQNHFAKVCRSKPEQKEHPPASQGNRYKHKFKKPVKPLRNIEHEKYDTESSDSDENYLYAVTNTTTPKVNVKICQHSFKATVDTGASINVIDQNTYAKMKGVELQRTSVKAFAYNSAKPVKFIGKFETTVETRKRIAVATFYVAKTTDSGNLISLTTAQELGLISLHLNKVSMTKDRKLGKILDKHAN